MTSHPNREQWLANVAEALRVHFAFAGWTVPANIKMTCGFPSKAATSRKAQRIGECWDSSRSDGQVFEIFISPVLADPLVAAATLAHEMVHATVGLKCNHRGPFAKCARAIGLQGKMTATEAGEAFKRWFADNESDLGPYQHAKLNVSSAPKKQTTRMLKCECPMCREDGNPYIVRLTASALEIGAPICPVHNITMEA